MSSGKFGTITFNVPSFLEEGQSYSAITQQYLNFYDSGLYEYENTTLGQSPTYPYTGNTSFSYLGIGGSRIEEKRKYGSTDYVGVTGGVNDEGVVYSAYTFTYTGDTMTGATLQYVDYEDGYTLITGTTHGFKKEEVINYVLSRNEHFLGFVEQPTIYSDVFVERGKQGVMELNLRLGEIDNIGELGVYGGGYFKVKKQ